MNENVALTFLKNKIKIFKKKGKYHNGKFHNMQ